MSTTTSSPPGRFLRGPRTTLLQRAESLPLLFRRTGPSLRNTQPQQTNDGDDRVDNCRLGRCLSCGLQLYQLPSNKRLRLFRKNKDEPELRETPRVPLNVPGQVQRGQCIQCSKEISLLPPPLEEEEKEEPFNLNQSSYLPSSIPTAKTAVYQGTFNVYGERDGTGSMTWDNGDVYKGDFFNGNRHGHGTLTFADGSEYVGGWECNHQHGVGTRRWNNGDCYTGQYLNGKRTGEGRFYFSNGDLYVGMWEDGVMHGAGRYYYASGQRFEGYFQNGHRRGKGKLQRMDGSIDVGVYEDDVRQGVGVRWSANRTDAWRMLDGVVKQKISIPEAVAMDYDIDAAVLALDRSDRVV